MIATLLHDPTVEGLDVALYMDGSASMEDEYGPRGVLAKLAPVKNQVEPQMRWMLEYLANKDRNGVLRVAYWATGDGSSSRWSAISRAPQAKAYRFPGPRFYGKGTSCCRCCATTWPTSGADGGRRPARAGGDHHRQPALRCRRT